MKDENKALRAAMRDTHPDAHKVEQTTVRIAKWKIDAVMADAAANGLDGISYNEAINLLVNMRLDEIGIEPPPEMPNEAAVNTILSVFQKTDPDGYRALLKRQLDNLLDGAQTLARCFAG